MLRLIETSFVRSPGRIPPEELIFGRSVSMQAVRASFAKVAAANVPVLIRGESGTGKETIAKLIHYRSDRRGGSFVKVNCAAIPEPLLESELFGYEKGAFTGAFDSKPGLIESANGGSLLIDEVAELSMTMQAKLLEVLQDGHFARLGACESRSVDARTLYTTSHDLDTDVREGTFRHDLFYRINVVALTLPPLRDRLEDIPDLAEYFRERFNREYGCDAAPIASRTLRLFEQHHWSGNIRELENSMKRYVVLNSEDALAQELLAGNCDIIDKLNRENHSVSLKSLTREAVRDLERKIILQVLHANNWNRKEAARILKVSYRSLFYKIKNSGVPGKKTKQIKGKNNNYETRS